MELTLFQATLLAGILIAALGTLFAAPSKRSAALIRGFPRSRLAAYVTMIIGGAWTLYMVAHLGDANYGAFKKYIFVAFAAVGVLSFKYAPDFLSVRGACILFLLIGNSIVGAAFGHYEEPLRLFFVTPIFVGFALSLYLAYSPFRLRDFFSWLFANASRPRTLGLIFLLYGGFVSALAFAY
ncbi:MAG: hypothetical protein ACI92G_004347 [Candidatus Pelagisphaera sp.]|jgi:hypothetical protein|tara:strand:- start:107 stop:652 length:546 start_codon:yes stop_codon:yes gene_type:complete